MNISVDSFYGAGPGSRHPLAVTDRRPLNVGAFTLVNFLHASGNVPGRASEDAALNAMGSPAGDVPFSFADDLQGRIQPVRVALGDFVHPGEVIVAGEWRAEFGTPLSGVSMFRLVLLRDTVAPAPEEVLDDRICVAAPRVNGGRIGEMKAAYDVGSRSGDSASQRPLRPGATGMSAADIRSLREVRRSYLTASDPGLGRLASALAAYESRVDASAAADLHEMWKSGIVVTSPGGADSVGSPTINPRELFLLDQPESWVESAAAVLSRDVANRTSAGFGAQSSAEQIFDELKAGRVSIAKDRLRQLCDIRIGEPTPVDQIDTLVATGGGHVSGNELVQLFIHELRYPPAVASLWLIVCALERGAELVLHGVVQEHTGSTHSGHATRREYLSSDTISEFNFDDDLIARAAGLNAEKSNDWDAVLPFLKLVSPQASFTAYGGGRDSDAIEVGLQLATLHSRLQQTSPVMFRLEVAAGASDRPLTRSSSRLSRVLEVDSWQDYVGMARETFGSVGALRAALVQAAEQWTAVEFAPDIERTIYYLDQVEFGRIDHALAVEHRALRARFDLTTLVESPHRWRALFEEYERWRQVYRKAYLQDHASRQQHDRRVGDQVERTARRVVQLGQLEQIDVLLDGSAGGQLGDFANRWDRVADQFRVCDRDGSSLRLVDEPTCPDCQGRLGQGADHSDVIELIAEVDRAFEAYRDRFAELVSDLVLKSQNSDRLQKLFRLNSAGDLSDLANVLDDKVISFLNELFDDASGNHGDWTFPHS